MYVDYMLAMSNPWNGVCTFTNCHIGGLGTTGGASPSLDYISDVQLSTRPIMIPVHPALAHVNIYGDSFVKLGQYPSANFAILGQTEDGSSGATFDADASNRDEGMVVALHKTLNSYGLGVGGNRIKCWHEGGSGIETGSPLTTRMDISVNGSYPMPTTAFIAIGTNDISGASTFDATWKASYQTEIDKLISNGCNRIIIANIAPLNVETTYNTAAYDTGTDLANTLIAELADDNTEVTVVDIFTKFGGHTGFSAADFKTGDRHPSPQGSAKIGKWMAEALLNTLQ